MECEPAVYRQRCIFARSTGCDGRLTYAEMRVVSNCWSDTIPSVQCAGQLQAGRLLNRRGTFQMCRYGPAAHPFAPTVA